MSAVQRSLAAASLFGFLAIFGHGILIAADAKTPATGAKKPNWAATSLTEVDEDFRFQGEYVGAVTLPGQTATQAVGLQVVALGDGQFQAVLLPGGLPGAGWTKKERLALMGAREGHRLTLGGAGLGAVVERDTVQVTASGGQPLGTLSRTARQSPTLGRACPDSGDPLYTDEWKQGFVKARRTKDRLLMVGTETKYPVRDSLLHLEFRLPYMPYARGQGRGNSGVYIQSRYEVQILDSFGLEGKNNECGSLYTYKAPDVNMCLPPLAWQTYDIEFRSPRFDASGRKYQNATLTVWHNGVLVQNRFDVERKTGAGQQEGPVLLPTKLQDHGNPVHFRNIWVVNYEQPAAVAPLSVVPPPVFGITNRPVYGAPAGYDPFRNVIR